MSHHVFVRPYRPEDLPLFQKWLFETKNNQPDPAAILAPTSFVTCAYNDNGPILFAPVQVPMFMESLAVNPEATPSEKSAALKAVVQFLVSQAHIQGRAEVYFLASDDATAAFAANHVFEEVPLKLFRLRVTQLETGANKG